MALRKIRKPVKIIHTAFAKHRVQGPNFIGEMCIPEKVIELCQRYSSAEFYWSNPVVLTVGQWGAREQQKPASMVRSLVDENGDSAACPLCG